MENITLKHLKMAGVDSEIIGEIKQEYGSDLLHDGGIMESSFQSNLEKYKDIKITKTPEEILENEKQKDIYNVFDQIKLSIKY